MFTPVPATPRSEKRTPVKRSNFYDKREVLHEAEITALVKVLRQIQELETMVEQSKMALTLKDDFNMHDAFGLFDPGMKGSIEVTDIADGLSEIGVIPKNLRDVDLFVARYAAKG